MTDGSVALLSTNPDGTALEIKTIDAHDGQGLTLAHTRGPSNWLHHGPRKLRAGAARHEMKMEFIYQKQPLKMPALEEIMQKAGVTESAVAYVGDDLPDLPIMRRVGLAIAVGDAVPQVKQQRTTSPKPMLARARSARQWSSS